MSNTVINPYNFVVANVGSWKELGRTTLGSKTQPITVSSLPDKPYYMVLSSVLADGTNRAAAVRRLGNSSVDTGNNYASRRNDNGGLESTNLNFNTAAIVNLNTDRTPQFAVDYVSNLSSEEKLAMTNLVLQNTAGAGNAPQRAESVWKWVNTSNPLDIYQITREPSESGDWEAGSECVVLGYDPTDTHTTADNFWQELASVGGGGTSNLSTGTFTAKKYLWVQIYKKQTRTGNSDSKMNFNNDTSSNYASRENADGGTDSTRINQSTMYVGGEGGHQNLYNFSNFFIINNSANEKLVIQKSIDYQTTGAASAPHRWEMVHKWTNTSSQITEIDFDYTNGTFDSESIVKVWGSD